MPVQPSVAFVIAFVALALACAAGFVWAVAQAAEPDRRRAWRLRATLGAVALLAITTAGAASGVLRQWDLRPPPIFVVLALLFGLTLVIGLSGVGKRLAMQLPWALLVGYQAFRVLVELLLHWGHVEGFVPGQMTYTGLNFDILTGLSALGLAALIAKRGPNRRLLLIWNVLGLGLLVNVLTVAILSMPLPIQQFESTNVWVTYPPFVWLPAIMVQLALLGHVLVFRRLASERSRATGAPAYNRGPSSTRDQLGAPRGPQRTD